MKYIHPKHSKLWHFNNDIFVTFDIDIYTSDGFLFLGINYYVYDHKLIKRISKRNKKMILKKVNKNNYKFYKNYFKYIR